MIKRQNFINMMQAFDEFYDDKMLVAFNTLGMQECKIFYIMDQLLETLSRELDPYREAAVDDLTHDCGDYLCDWLFTSDSELREQYPTPGALYDYIISRYKETE